MRSRLVGSVHVANLAAAWATARRLGLAPDAVSAGLAAAPPPPGRNTLLGGTGGRPLVVVDYAHTPAALSAALSAARDLDQGAEYAWSFRAEILSVAVGLVLTVVLLVQRRWGEGTYVGLSVAALAT